MERTTIQLDAKARLSGKIVYASDSTKPIHAFLGIPYALPPTGKRRFKAPQQHPLWDGEKDAIKFGSVCPQDFARTARTYGAYALPSDNASEDCLYLNVWTPNTSPQTRLPVMVWIYGGAFTQGFSDYYDGTAWSTFEDVVFVSINYRIGALGFLPSIGLEIHGNCGLLDQVEALRWVQMYISRFGGNPKNVTIFGESAGGISCSLHCLSPLSRGLFRRAICQSGAALYPSIVWKNEGLVKYLKKRLQAMGCTDMSDVGMTKFLQQCTTDDLVHGIQDGIIVLDGYYLTKMPEASYIEGDVASVEMIQGICSHEGIPFILEILYRGKTQTLKASSSNRVTSYEQAKFMIEFMVDRLFFRGKPGAAEVVEAIMKQYFGPAVRGEDELTAAVANVYGDPTFLAPCIQTANLHSARSPTYLYLYDHKLSVSRNPDFITGASHAEEVPMIIGEAFLERIPHIWSESEKKLTRTMIKYWAQFARTGNPNTSGLPEWPKFQSGSGHDNYLQINTSPSAHKGLFHDRADFWLREVSQIYQHYGAKSKY